MSKKISILSICLIAALSLTAILAIWLGKRELHKQQQAYLNAGGILNPAQLIPPKIPDEINAAAAYEPIFAYFNNMTYEDHQPFMHGDGLYDPAMPEILARSGHIVTAIHTAAALPQCRWETSKEAFDNFSQPEPLSGLADAARLIEADLRFNLKRATLSAAEYDARAIQDIELIFTLGYHASLHPTTLGQSVAASLFAQGADLYEELFRDHPAPPHRILEILSKVDLRANYRQVLMREGLYFEAQCAASSSLSFGLLTAWDRAYYLENLTTAFEETGTSFYQALGPTNPPWYAFQSKLSIYGIDHAGQRLAQQQIRVEILKTVEQLRAYKSKHSSYPQPDANIIALPTDPLTGKPIKYETVNEGFILTTHLPVAREDYEEQWIWEY